MARTFVGVKKCERPGCDKQAVWDWTPRMMYLCDEHAADCDLSDLEEL
jgi:hypothetical protein